LITLLIISNSAMAIPVTVSMTADNAIISGGVCSDVSCMGGTLWTSIGSGLVHGDDWTQSDSISLDLDYGTHYFAWNLVNIAENAADNPAGLLASISWAGGLNASSSAWEIYDFATGVTTDYATEYGQNSASASHYWNSNGGPVAGISDSAQWIFSSTNFSGNSPDSLWIRTSITLTQVPEPGSFILLGSGLVGLMSFYRRRIV